MSKKAKEKTLGQRLKSYRKKHNMTQSDMALLFGLSLTGYVNWEKDLSTPSDENMQKVNEVLN